MHSMLPMPRNASRRQCSMPWTLDGICMMEEHGWLIEAYDAGRGHGVLEHHAMPNLCQFPCTWCDVGESMCKSSCSVWSASNSVCVPGSCDEHFRCGCIVFINARVPRHLAAQGRCRCLPAGRWWKDGPHLVSMFSEFCIRLTFAI